ncbi:MAG: hypothetical protein CMJ83_00685 [Planctomycetes bacterium]|nr:hypothetical protein [Planctomycetota bacterium]
MRIVGLVIGLLALSGPVAVGQHLDSPTHFVWLLDRGAVAGGGEALHVCHPDGTLLATLPLPGAGPPRGFSFDRRGFAWLARGDAIWELDPMGVATGRSIQPPLPFAQAQDVLETPSGHLAVAWGMNAGSSGVSWHDAGSLALVSSVSGGGFIHPRRLATSPDPAMPRIYVSTSGPSNAVWEINYLAGVPIATIITNLGPTLFPVGLAYDATHDGFWTAGDFGGNNEIGFVDRSTGVYTPEFGYPAIGAPGLTAPGGLIYDRYGMLWIIGRDRNQGITGAYVFRASDASQTPSSFTPFPSNPGALTNLIDVDQQPVVMDLCVPLAGTDPILELGAANRITLDSPSEAGCLFAIAMSNRWNGVMDLGLELGLPDTRGLPLTFDDLFRGSAGVETPGSPPPVGGPNLSFFGILITGFTGFLDGNGQGQAFIDLTPLNDPSLDGIELSLGYVTADGLVSSGIGLISQPIPVTLRFNPQGIVVCP